MKPRNPTICRMSPQRRKHLDPRSKTFEIRFAIRLRALVDGKGWGPLEFTERLNAAGLDVGIDAVSKWLNGGSVPRLQALELIGHIIGKDYRQLLPDPIRMNRN